MPSRDYRFPPSIREVFLRALPADTSLHGNVPELRYTYLPTAHIKALRPDNMLVVGIRGSGKSFWYSVLQQPSYRNAIGTRVGIDADTLVSSGFGEKSAPDEYPGKDSLRRLLDRVDARKLWLTVVVHQIAKQGSAGKIPVLKPWDEKVDWVQKHPEEVERYLFAADNALEQKQKYHLILFDALDRSADDWQTMNALIRGLLQVALDFRSFKRLRLKLFVRPDHIEDPTVASFPDSSKILSQKMELYWQATDLYGMLWQYLANEPDHGRVFRDGCQELLSIEWEQTAGAWVVPDRLRQYDRMVFHAITGPWMGRDARRGFPYTWLVNHLGDTRKEVSPRSFLAALRHAANDPDRKDFQYALHYESIKRGVQEASRIRVEEMQEDYPWVNTIMRPLKGRINVPCNFDDIVKIWRQAGTLRELQQSVQKSNVRLPPSHIQAGETGVLEDLVHLGLAERLSHNRINLPDVYRVGYGLGRHGGVKPVARHRDER